MRKYLYRFVFILACATCLISQANAQVTSSSFSGMVLDETLSSVVGATVRATHTPSGTNYGSVTRDNGQFNLPNVRNGGPYVITVSYMGYNTSKQENIFLKLGENRKLIFKMTEMTQKIDAVSIIGDTDDIFDDSKIGPATNVGKDEIDGLPSISRSLSDYTRLTPQSSGGGFGGNNRRYNAISIDGAANNDLFGLSGSGAPGGQQGNSVSGTPGGKTGSQPISLDAIDEIQIVLAPYDVKQGGFTGAGVNAVTKSGTNTAHGSVYYFLRNQELIGLDPLNPDADRNKRVVTDFYEYTSGMRLGSYIIKNKLFFFVNGEIVRNDQPLLFEPGTPSSDIDVTEAQKLYDHMLTNHNYDAGSFRKINKRMESNKIFARLDWNINNNHQLTLRHNFIDAFSDNIRRSNNSLIFQNGGYRMKNVTNSTVLEWKAMFGSNKSNSLILGYNSIRDQRIAGDVNFARVSISDPKKGSFTLGSEPYSASNSLDQDVFEITDNFDIYKGKHTFTIGTHNEFFSFKNLFIPNSTGTWSYRSLDNFYANKPHLIQASYSKIAGKKEPTASFNAMQLGLYVQDAIDLSDKFRMTVGFRVDAPIYPDKPAANPLVESTYGVKTDNVPKTQLLMAPRVGFNLAVSEKIQLRAGAGIFTGRVPFVWLSNQFSNAGDMFSSVYNKLEGKTVKPFDPKADLSTLGAGSNRAEINVITENFKLPQSLRANLSADFGLPGGVVLTTEFIYSKTLNDITYDNLNLKKPIGKLKGDGPKGRDVFPLDSKGYRDLIDGKNFTRIVQLRNTNEGYRYTATAQLRKKFDNGLNVMAAYNYGKAYDVNSGLSSQAKSNYRYNQIVNHPGKAPLSYSAFDMRHRVVSSVNYRVEYAGHWATSIGLVYQARSGYKFTHLYNGDVNNDGEVSNDLMYIPKNESEVILVPSDNKDTRTPTQIWNQLDQLIENDPYLKENRGSYAERMGGSTPWVHQLDLRFMQEFKFESGREHKFQLSLDIMNFTNLLNNKWGHQYYVSYSAWQVLRFQGLDSDEKPTYSLDSRNVKQKNAWRKDPLLSRWSGQVGLRYLF